MIAVNTEAEESMATLKERLRKIEEVGKTSKSMETQKKLLKCKIAKQVYNPFSPPLKHTHTQI